MTAAHKPPVEATELRRAVADALSRSGALAREDPQFRPRAVQADMADAVAQAIEQHRVLVAEAGTGVGKTFAYLVPLLLSGARALVSTATKSLQDQLFLRDLPRLAGALSVPVRMALLKGRASYLCLHRLEQARSGAQLPDRFAVRALARIEEWSRTTRSGDLAELATLDERSPLIPLVTSSRDNCLGTECPRARECHVMRARREAMAADIVVVNHHLFFADVVLRDTGVAELLPSVEAVVFDEAHQLGEAGVQFLGQLVSTAQVIDFARDLLAAGLLHARGLRPWQELNSQCERAARDLRLACAGALRGSARLHWSERADRAEFADALQRLHTAFTQAAAAAQDVADTTPDFTKLAERGREIAERALAFTGDTDTGQVRWIDLTAHHARLVESPLSIADTLQAQIAAAPRAWVFTSATLGDDERLSWFTTSAGLDGAHILRAGSPFDYARHARLHVPAEFPRPNDAQHPLMVAKFAARCAELLQGRTFVLTTTLRALQTIGDELARRVADAGLDLRVLIQGSAPKRALLAQFLAGPPAVLVGSQSFWEGIDVPGDALQCVIIDKLPFPPPNDPLVQARAKRIEDAGGSAFNDYFVSEAAVTLKQGAGRLIRSETDRGLLVVCDPRLLSMGYGKRLLAALPPMSLITEGAEVGAWLRELAAKAGDVAPAD